MPKQGQNLLCLAESEHGNRHGASISDCLSHSIRETLLLVGTGKTNRRRRVSTGGFHKQVINPLLGKIRARHDRLLLEIHIPRVEEGFSAMANENTRRAENVACVVELESDLVIVVAEVARQVAALAQAATNPRLLAKIHTPVGVERILHEFQLLALAGHDIHGIVQHDVGYICRALGHENRGLRLPPGQDRQRADVVLVRVGYDNGIDDPFWNGCQMRR